MSQSVRVVWPTKMRGLFEPHRYKVMYGGRGGGKSWAIARALAVRAANERLRIGCFREYQSSIADSCHRLLKDQIYALGLEKRFWITDTSIKSTTGSEFLFKGLRRSIAEIRSTEGIDIAWVEEASTVSEESWSILVPTIRKDGSEIWISFNPDQDSDPTYQRFVAHPPPSAWVQKIGWENNARFPATLDAERRYMLETDPEAYEWVWGGHCRSLTDAVVFRGRVSFESFETPPLDEIGGRYYYGADWGFANDPTVLIRCFIKGDELFIDHEAFGYGVEIDDTAELFCQIPGARDWPIRADNSRPETISYMARQGFRIEAANKWPGSVEDGIAQLKGFRRIVVHERCKQVAQEFRLYSHKVDRLTGDVLPVLVDRHNHGIDGLRYSLDEFIRNGDSLAVWRKLGTMR
jgi:phage terminase large subunit